MPTAKSVDQVIDALVRDHTAAETICLSLSRLEMLFILANLQLALRHPNNSGPSSAITRKIALRLERILAPDPESDMGRICSAGWDTSLVVPGTATGALH
ncbi:MAG: hypothetical protein P4L55_08360 [Syntrophobacteraceae bacterium]|nr:hypothetical protein [Syntrophobacteraceae bacterium]